MSIHDALASDPRRSERTYGAHLAQMHAWAAELGCDPETVEYLIFHDEANARGNQWSR